MDGWKGRGRKDVYVNGGKVGSVCGEGVCREEVKVDMCF